MSWWRPRRSVEASPEQLVVTGAAGATSDGFRALGAGPREVPGRTLERARAASVAAYRANPMARAVIDTYTSFCVGDSGLTLQASHPEVREVAERFWHHPRVGLAGPVQELLLRDHLLMGESLLELLEGRTSGVTRFSPIDVTRIAHVSLERGNPLWPDVVTVRGPVGGDDIALEVIRVDDLTDLRVGEVFFWTHGKALLTDTRGYPFLGPILDWLDSYDQVLANLVDRTALARYLTWDVTIEGADERKIDEFIRKRGGTHAPRSGTVEVHNEHVKWSPQNAQVGSFEDTATSKTVLTNIAGGAGLAKTWLADPEDSNRATSLTMAEPVRRRVSGVQNVWLGHQTEMVRTAIDAAVRARRIPGEVTVSGDAGVRQVGAASTVTVSGPEVAAADAKVTAEVLHRLSLGLKELVGLGVMSTEAAKLAARKGWEDFVGVPYRSELDDDRSATPDRIADHVDEARHHHPARVALVG